MAVVILFPCSILYYTIRDGLSTQSRSLMKLSLSNINQPEEIPLNNFRISKVTYDDVNNSFYWIRHRPGHDKGDVIEKFSGGSTIQVTDRASQVEGKDNY